MAVVITIATAIIIEVITIKIPSSYFHNASKHYYKLSGIIIFLLLFSEGHELYF